MSKTWKWILGITLGLVILFGVGYTAAYFFGFGHMSSWGGPAYHGHPMMDDYGFRDRGPLDGFHGFRHPMMGRRGFYPLGGFFFLGGLLRWLFPLALLVLVGYFAYQKGRNDGAVEAQTATTQVESPDTGEKS